MLITAIIVTHNRLACLQRCIDVVFGQTRKPERVLVVNNASTDGTQQWLASQAGLLALRLASNVGSAGGFNEGIKKAHADGASHFWLLDDDSMPSPSALERLVRSVESEPFGFACSLVLWKDRSPHLMNNPQIAGGETWFHHVLTSKRIPARSASFVSILVSATAVAASGLPCREMFLWYDDAEFTTRLSRHSPSWLVLDSVVVHETPSNTYVDIQFMDATNWQRYCYGIRNMMAYARLYGSKRRSYWLLAGTLLKRVIMSCPLLGPRATAHLLRAWLSGLTFHPRPEPLLGSTSHPASVSR